jgi:hypothetical protein
MAGIGCGFGVSGSTCAGTIAVFTIGLLAGRPMLASNGTAAAAISGQHQGTYAVTTPAASAIPASSASSASRDEAHFAGVLVERQP